MSVTLILIGPHGAGKSTLAHQLTRDLGWPFCAEIGDVLRGEALDLDPLASAEKHQPDFDAEVMRRELERDLLWRGHGPRIVESWHLSNLAYARKRSPEIAARLEGVLRCAVEQAGLVLVQPVSANPEVLACRQREPGAPEVCQPFFREVAQQAEDIARSWGLNVLPILDTTDGGPDACARWVGTAIRVELARLGASNGRPRALRVHS